MSKVPIVFGTVVIDKLHRFFGEKDPTPAVVIDYWSRENYDETTMVNHYRGMVKVSYSDLRDTDKWEVLEVRIDTSKDVIKQLEEIKSRR